MARTVHLCVEEGQMVWFHSQARHISSEYVKVIETGTLWAVLSNGFRVNRYTGVCDRRGCDKPPGFVYLTREDCEAEHALYRTFAKLKKDIAGMVDLPEGMTRRQLLQIRRIFRMDE